MLVDRDDLARMADPAPGQVGDVQQAVDAAQVHERPEVGKVLDDALAFLADAHRAQQLAFGFLALLLDEAPAGNDDVPPVGVDLQDLALDFPAEVNRHVGRSADVHLAGRQEDRHADVHQQAALDLARDAALDDVALLVLAEDAFPAFDAVRLALRQKHQPAVVLDGFQEDVDLGARLGLCRGIELFERDAALALEAHVNHRVAADHTDHPPTDHAADLETLDRILVQMLQLPRLLRPAEHRIDFLIDVRIVQPVLALNLTFQHFPGKPPVWAAGRPLWAPERRATSRRFP